jgi:ribokinase
MTSHEHTPKICVIGSANMDLTAHISRLPDWGETITEPKLHTSFGGKGANQAVMAARLGAQVKLIARLGNDAFGRDMFQNYQRQGIDTRFVMLDEDWPTGVALIAVNKADGQNMMIVTIGANSRLSEADVIPATPAILESDVLVGQLETSVGATLEAFRIAKETPGSRVTTILNPAPAKEPPEALLRLTDILVPNENEAAMLTNTASAALAGDSGTLNKVAGALLRRGPRVVIITLGARGALVAEGEAHIQLVPAPKVQAVDTTGAGDAFMGSLAFFIASGRPILDAARRAGAVATRTVLKPGTQSSFPTREEVADILG